MLVGHFATALVANQKFPTGSLLYFLVVSQLQDILWALFHYFGLEVTTPTDVLDTTLQSLTVDMLYSHDLLPQIFWMATAFIFGRALFKSSAVGVVGAALFLCCPLPRLLLEIGLASLNSIWDLQPQCPT